VDHVEIEGKRVPVRWTLQPSAASGDAHIRTFVFRCEEPKLRLISSWHDFEGPGPVEHQIVLVNEGARDLLVPRQTSLAVSARAPQGVENWWVEKGGGTPTPVGIHRTPVTPQFSAKLKSGPLAATEPRDPIPFVTLHDTQSGGGWYAGLEFSGRVTMTLKARDVAESTVVDADLGLEPKEDLVTRVPPGGTYEPPVAFVGCFTGDLDDCGNHFRRWVADHLRPPVHEPKYPLLVNNSWGSGMAVDEKLARSMIDQSAELGLEMFHIDAGWFRTVGDWRADPKKFPGGLAPIADYAHSKGLKFGLWVGWTQVGNSPNYRDDPLHVVSTADAPRVDWLSESLTNGWKPGDFWGETICLADTDARDWCLNLLRAIVKEDKLDMLEHDQRMIPDNCPRTDHAHTNARVDVAFRAAQGYYHVYDELRKENPNLLFEDCVNGGQMVDFGVIRRVHYISITDTYDPLSNRRAFYDASYIIPPAMCECYIEQRPGKTPANFLYMLRSGMMGWCTIMLDTTKWTPQQHELAKRQFETYKTRLRPLINSANLYHVSDRPDGVRWDGIEYIDPTRGAGVLFAFRGTSGEAQHTFLLRGLDPQAVYEIVREDTSGPAATIHGNELMRTGITVTLPEPESSELIYLQRR
jgi:alpha-galactosidase